MPAQRTPVPACHASGQPSDAPALPFYTRLMSVASTPSGSTPTGHLTIAPADSGPTTHVRTATTPSRLAHCPNPAVHMHSVPVSPETPAIAVVIRRLRRRRGLSQSACAELIGYSESWLSQVERGERGVDSVRALRELARVLHVDVHKLIEVVL